MFALAVRESSASGRAVGLVVGLAAGLSLAIEVIQLVIPGRDVDLTSVLLAIVGSALGATLVTRIVVADAAPLDHARASWSGESRSPWLRGTHRDSPGPFGWPCNRRCSSRSGLTSAVARSKT